MLILLIIILLTKLPSNLWFLLKLKYLGFYVISTKLTRQIRKLVFFVTTICNAKSKVPISDIRVSGVLSDIHTHLNHRLTGVDTQKTTNKNMFAA